MRWRYGVVAFGFFIMLITIGLWASGSIKFTFFPKVEGDTINCYITMPTGTSVEETNKVVSRLEKSVKEIINEFEKKRPEGSKPLLEFNMSFIGFHIGGHGKGGTPGGHLGQLWIQLLNGEDREISATEISKAWRERIGPVYEAESISFSSELHSGGVPIALNLSMDDNEELIRAKEDLKKKISEFNGVFDVKDDYLTGKKEAQLKLKSGVKSLGLTLNDLAIQVRNAFYGSEAGRMQRNKNEIKVIVRYPENERKSLENLESMRIQTMKGFEIPFSQVAQVHMDEGFATIQREQRMRVIQVTGDIDAKVANANEIRSELVKNFMPELKKKYPGLRFTLEGEGKDQKESLNDVIKGFIIALFCIYALLAIPFKSFLQPLIIMTAIPFGIVGAIWGHIIMGFDLSIISLFGIVGLTGVVVNDSLVLIDATNRLKESGELAFNAAVEGGSLRFRAILLTSLTTFAGLTPMLLEQSIQAKFLIPMAISLGFGVLFATQITLFLIPCGYMILNDITSFFSFKKE